jgi:BCCT family betaine/carnitine transporter
MQGSEPSEPDHNIDWFIFISTAIIVIGVCVPLILFPEAGARSASTAFDFVTAKFGVFYIGAGIARSHSCSGSRSDPSWAFS